MTSQELDQILVDAQAAASADPALVARLQLARDRFSLPCKPDGQHYYGTDCPVGMVQVEFVGVSPSERFSDYGWKPTPHAFVDLYVDGRRFNVQVGTFEAFSGSRRGLHIVTDDIDLRVDKHSLNAVDVFFDSPPVRPTEKPA